MSNIYENDLSSYAISYTHSGQNSVINYNDSIEFQSNPSSQRTYYNFYYNDLSKQNFSSLLQDSGTVEFSKIYDYNYSNSRRNGYDLQSINPYFSYLHSYDKEHVFGGQMNINYNLDSSSSISCDVFPRNKRDKGSEEDKPENFDKKLSEKISKDEITPNKVVKQEIIDFEKIEPELIKPLELPDTVNTLTTDIAPKIVISNFYHEDTSKKIKEILINLKTDLENFCKNDDGFLEQAKDLLDNEKNQDAQKIFNEPEVLTDTASIKNNQDSDITLLLNCTDVQFINPNERASQPNRKSRIIEKFKILSDKKERDEKKFIESYIEKSKKYVSRKKSISKSFLLKNKSKIKHKFKPEKVEVKAQPEPSQNLGIRRKNAHVFAHNNIFMSPDEEPTDNNSIADESGDEKENSQAEFIKIDEELSMPVRNLQVQRKNSSIVNLKSSEDEEDESELVKGSSVYDQNFYLKSENKKLELKLEELADEIEEKISNIRRVSIIQSTNFIESGLIKSISATESQNSRKLDKQPKLIQNKNNQNNKKKIFKISRPFQDLKDLIAPTKSTTSSRSHEPIYSTKAYMQPGVYSYLVSSKPSEVTASPKVDSTTKKETTSLEGNSLKTLINERNNISDLKDKTKDFLATRGSKLNSKIKEKSGNFEKKKISESVIQKKENSDSETESDFFETQSLEKSLGGQEIIKRNVSPSIVSDESVVEFLPIESENLVPFEKNKSIINTKNEPNLIQEENQLPPKNILKKNKWISLGSSESESDEYSVPTNIQVQFSSSEDETINKLNIDQNKPFQRKIRQRNSFILDNMLGIKQRDSNLSNEMYYKEPVAKNVDFDMSKNETINIEQKKKRFSISVLIRDLKDSPKERLKKSLRLSEKEETGTIYKDDQSVLDSVEVDEEEKKIRRHLEATREEDLRVIRYLEAQRADKITTISNKEHSGENQELKAEDDQDSKHLIGQENGSDEGKIIKNLQLEIIDKQVEEILEEEDLNKTQRAEEMSSKPNLDLIKPDIEKDADSSINKIEAIPSEEVDFEKDMKGTKDDKLETKSTELSAEFLEELNGDKNFLKYQVAKNSSSEINDRSVTETGAAEDNLVKEPATGNIVKSLDLKYTSTESDALLKPKKKKKKKKNLRK